MTKKIAEHCVFIKEKIRRFSLEIIKKRLLKTIVLFSFALVAVI
jgi:hypothetical protein